MPWFLWQINFKFYNSNVGLVLRDPVVGGGKYYMCFVENFILFSVVQKLWEWSTFGKSYHQLYNVLFLWTTVYEHACWTRKSEFYVPHDT